MKKMQPVGKPRLVLDTAVIRRLDDASLRKVDGGMPPMRSNAPGDDTCTCNITIWTK
jgi:hypothetical protein